MKNDQGAAQSTPELLPTEREEAIFARLCAKYVQRADARQQSMDLQYTEAETHDLARFIARIEHSTPDRNAVLEEAARLQAAKERIQRSRDELTFAIEQMVDVQVVLAALTNTPEPKP